MAEQRIIGKKRTIILIIFLGVFLTSLIIFRSIPLDVRKTYNQFVTTEDDIKICYNVFEPTNNDSTNKKAVLIGHGVMVNKEVMKMMALELAKNDFVVVSFDFRGHGRSGGDFNYIADNFNLDNLDMEEHIDLFNFNILTRDIKAIKEEYLANRGDIDMANLGYIGYSMGGGAGFEACFTDNDFKAMIGLCPAIDVSKVNTTNPKNLLILASKYDEAIVFDDVLKAMENKTEISTSVILESVNEKNYWEYDAGSFTTGTAARVYRNPYQEHFLAPWDKSYIKEARNWMLRALQGESNPNILQSSMIYNILSISLILEIIGAMGIFFILSGLIVSKLSKRREETLIEEDKIKEWGFQEIVAHALIYIVLLSFPCMLLFLPFFLGHLLITGFMLMLIFGPSMAIFFYLRAFMKKRDYNITSIYKEAFKTTNIQNILIGLTTGFMLYFLLQISIGQIFSIMPATFDWLWVPFYFGITFLIYFNFIMFFQPLIQEKIGEKYKNTALVTGCFNFAANVLLSLFILLTPCLILGNYFIFMFFVPVVGLHAVSSFTATYIYSKNKDVILVTIATALIPCLMFSTLSPIIWIGNFV
ncbi:MAG: hypothetical protein GF364_04395 [Candidatus Lokiarchaeota archaeon]|nr:hypothetical protein [Candidatus Lokiarchaeota archaeon]